MTQDIHANTRTAGRFAVARGVQIDTRRLERLSANERRQAPTLVPRDILNGGDLITAADLEGGAPALLRLVELGQVLRLDDGLPAGPLKPGLYVAPGQSVCTRRGILPPGTLLHAFELGTPADLETMVERGVVLRVLPPEPDGDAPPEAA